MIILLERWAIIIRDFRWPYDIMRVEKFLKKARREPDPEITKQVQAMRAQVALLDTILKDQLIEVAKAKT